MATLLVTENEKVNVFLARCIRELETAGITLKIYPTYSIMDDGCTISGYFSEHEKVLAIAIGKPLEEWFDIFIHEYCHFRQWKRNCKAWDIAVKEEAYEHFFGWLEKQIELTPEDLKRHMKLVRNLESDCDKKAIGLIKRHALPVDLDIYKRGAIIYSYFYTYVAKNRCWTLPGKLVYRNPKALKHIKNGNLRRNYDRLPLELEKIFDAECKKGR